MVNSHIYECRDNHRVVLDFVMTQAAACISYGSVSKHYLLGSSRTGCNLSYISKCYLGLQSD